MRVSDWSTSSCEVTRCCCSARCSSVMDVSTTVNRGGPDGAAATATAVASARISPLLFISTCRSAECTACLVQQIGLDKWIEVSVEHSVDVANLHLRPVVLDHLIGLQDVAADLAAEADFLFRAGDLLELGRLLLHPEIEQPCLEHLHRLRAVLVL